MTDYSIQELMIIASAREIQDGELVFVGMRLPITAYGVARLTHAPDAVGLFECGVARYAPATDMLYTMGDPPNQLNAAWTTGLIPVMSQLTRGRVDAGFIGGAEVDRFGNVNTSYIGDYNNPKIKLPGSGGAADIAAMSKRLLVIINHEERRLVEKVDYVTSPGYLDGGDSRDRAGLQGGPSAIITDLAILRPYGPDNEMHLASLHQGHSVEEVQEKTGWDLKVSPKMIETPPPSAEEMAALHEIDKEGFWR
ncbi:MAG: CoA-transferase [Rhodospirillaceae bacterium]|jgi:glutaconate CoA-transferase, subunit B|nr:CoA-transferase [Rhodospirillaceae bacterium]MBT5243835.1 CoA-transferase [Rhodospirillaceae bacterium]MBT5562884.1 CoA-transferase [Rhodospirillaceae bacterium]MBT6241283.1 CoA-transferase [Rhodospirillaceae bacterium]MBT7138754.1 CoA-transferase [Rhodospirillaceae bacterium]